MPATSAPENVSALLGRLDEVTERLPKRLRQCAIFTRRHMHLVAVTTVSEIAGAAGVAPSVFIRFCQALGFSGYSEMQDLFRVEVTQFRPDYDERLSLIREMGEEETGRLLSDFVEAGHQSLMGLRNTTTNEILERITKGLASANMIHLVGYRRAFAVVSSMAYLLDNLGVPAMLHASQGMLETAQAVRKGDAVLAVTFSPFSPETLDFVEGAVGRGLPAYVLTDSEDCPVSEGVREVLIAREAEVAGLRGLNAAVTLATTLAVATSISRKQS